MVEVLDVVAATVSRRINVNIAVDVFQSYRDTLNDAITSDGILRLANALYSTGIISRENLDHAMLTGVLPTEKKVHLFDAIEARSPHQLTGNLQYWPRKVPFCPKLKQ